MNMAVCAVDVGFGETKYVKRSQNGNIDCDHFPSQAIYSPTESVTNGLGGKRKTVCVPIDNHFYEVGPEVELAADRLRAWRLHDGYTETDDYRALTAGALHFMKADVVDLLVLGLPVAQYMAKRGQLERAMTGAFDLGRKRKIVVKKVLVVAQPQGALMHYASTTGRLSEVLQSRSLVIDAGSRTFDWLVTRGTRVVPNMSHSVNRGASDVQRTIARAISKDIGAEYTDYQAIDMALRSGKSLRIFQKPYDLKHFDKTVQTIAEQAVDLMCEHLENTYSFDHVLLAGGASFMFKKVVKQRFPKLTIQEMKDPIYANVKGFLIFGEQFARENHLSTSAAASVAPAPEAD